MISILAIESSCDETSAAVCVDGKILSNVVASQKVHEKYGGVVPELAARAHIENIIPVVEEAIQVSSFEFRAESFEFRVSSSSPEPGNLKLETFSAFAFTQSPGLMGSLLVGAQFAKSLALAFDRPLIAVHHMQAHVLANLIGDEPPAFPFLCLTVSGGHTQIVLAHAPLNLEVIGQTIDDAAGEAFDKCAKMLGLPYPGGPLVDKLAQGGDALRYKFAEPMVDGLNFSFSGLKTSVLYFLRDRKLEDADFVAKNLNDICASLQQAIINILLKKMKRALQQTGVRHICLAGGVSANSGLRKAFQAFGERENCSVYIPKFEYCTDNAAMIAITAHYKYLAGEFADMSISPSARAVW